jgi:hypothetical protein
MRRPARWTTRLAAWLGCAALLPAWTLAAASSPQQFQPYTARYQVSYRGLNGGEIEASFRRGREPNQWQYETHAFPSLLGRLAVSTAAHELGRMLITPAGVRPLSFEFEDGSASGEKDVHVAYDWAGGKATGTAKGTTAVLDLVPGTQDTASVQAAMIQELLAGRKPQGFRLITGNKVHDYKYWSEGTQQVTTPFGRFDAVVWANQRPGSNRVSKVWHAPALGYVPIQAIQYRKGKAEVEMKLLRLQRAATQ